MNRRLEDRSSLIKAEPLPLIYRLYQKYADMAVIAISIFIAALLTWVLK